MKLARRANISPSLTLAMNTKAKEMQAKGIDVISFAAGEPDFPTPDYVKEAGINAINTNKTYYTPASGIKDLKEAVIEKLARENNLEYKIGEVCINSGAKHSVFNALAVVVEDGDEVVFPAPYWVSYSEMVKILGGKPVVVPTSVKDDFKMKARDLEKRFTYNTKVVLLNSPNNPTGCVYTKEEIYEIAEFLEDKDVIIISDEIYEKIIYDGYEHVSIATYSENIRNKTVVVNGLSKAFSMTGWRIGYCAGPEEIISAIGKLQGHTSGNPTSISQYAGVTALTGDTSFIESWVSEFKKRRDYIVDVLNSIGGVECSIPRGAFYVFPGIEAFFGRKTSGGVKINDSVDLANYLLEEAHIAVVPGKAFGDDGYIRISFATSMENIKKGMERLRKALIALS